MKNSLFQTLIAAVILNVLTFLTAFSQNVSSFLIKGVVIDSASKKHIEYATISMMNADRQVISLTYSDENGAFKSADVGIGAYFLNISFVGYRQKTVSFQIQAPQPLDLGIIALSPEINQLQAITITGQKQLVEQQPGMLIYNAEKDISNQGGTAADVLRKAPILNVDAAGNVSMRGNANLRILINGKYSGQMARSPGDALNMMPANSIKSVEVITSPSARYDAEGAAGVINIITKKGSQKASGTVEVVGGNLEQAINPRVAINRDKWNVSTTLHLHRLRSKELINTDRTAFAQGTATGKVNQNVVSDNIKPHSSGDVQVEFMPDSANLFNFSANGWLGRWPQNSEQFNRRSLPDGTLLEAYQQSVTTKAPNKGIDLNLGYTRKFAKPGEELYFMAQHNASIDDYDYSAFQTDDEKLLLYKETNDNRTKNQEWTFQADYILPFGKSGKHALESGAKGIFRNVSSNYQVAASNDSNPNVLLPILNRSDQFDYRQDVVAAYSQAKFKWNDGWALHAGARMEGTFLEGNQVNAGSNFTNQFWNFVPSATVFKKLNANNNLTLSYTKRISRPSIWDLNPNRDSQDPNNIVVGNPALRPEELNQVEFTYAMQSNSDFFVNFSLFGRQTNNSIESIVTIDNAGIATTTKQNLASNGQYGVNFSTAFSVTEGWKINGNANVRYAKFESNALNIRNDGNAWGINLNSSWKLPNNYSLQAYGDYDARKVTLQGHNTAWFYYSFSAKKEIPAHNLTCNLTVANPFNNYISQTEFFKSPEFTSSRRTQYMLRSVRLSVSWEFGGMFKAGNSRKITNDDLKNIKQGG